MGLFIINNKQFSAALAATVILLGGLFLPFGGNVFASTQAEGFDQRHSRLAYILNKYNFAGLVDYSSITKEDKIILKQYLNELKKTSRPSFQSWTKDQQLAFLINLYNANTLALILENYPVASIRDIGWFGLGPWGRDRVEVFDDTISLDDLEHDIIRPQYQEPRIHFALVCAAKGCPALRTEPYTAEKLEAQLQNQAQQFMRQTDKNYLRGNTVVLSKIFKWYGEDFGRDQTALLQALLPYWPLATQQAMLAIGLDNLDIEYSDYDWSLNETQ